LGFVVQVYFSLRTKDGIYYNDISTIYFVFIHQEAAACAAEFSRADMPLFAFNSLMNGLEKSPQSRLATGTLLRLLVRQRILTLDQLVEGLSSILELSDELVIDISRFWQCLASLVSPIVDADGGLTLPALRTACSVLRSPPRTGELIAMVLEDNSLRLVCIRNRLLFMRHIWYNFFKLMKKVLYHRIQLFNVVHYK